MPIFMALSAVFKGWMLIDAIRRGGCCNNYWHMVIVFVPFGEWAYFLMVKTQDPEFAFIRKKLFVRPPSLDQFRAHFKHSPNAYNKSQLAWALFNHDQYQEARTLFSELYAADQADKQTRLGLAFCEAQLESYEQARLHLEALTAHEMGYKDYSAASELADVYWKSGDKDRCVEFLRSLVLSSKRLSHKVALAKRLYELDRVDQARVILEEGLEEFQHSPHFVRKVEKRPAKEASMLLKGIQRAHVSANA